MPFEVELLGGRTEGAEHKPVFYTLQSFSMGAGGAYKMSYPANASRGPVRAQVRCNILASEVCVVDNLDALRHTADFKSDIEGSTRDKKLDERTVHRRHLAIGTEFG